MAALPPTLATFLLKASGEVLYDGPDLDSKSNCRTVKVFEMGVTEDVHDNAIYLSEPVISVTTISKIWLYAADADCEADAQREGRLLHQEHRPGAGAGQQQNKSLYTNLASLTFFIAPWTRGPPLAHLRKSALPPGHLGPCPLSPLLLPLARIPWGGPRRFALAMAGCRQDAEHRDACHGGPSAAQLAVGAAQQHHNQQDGEPADGCRVGKPGTTTGVDNHDPDQKKR